MRENENISHVHIPRQLILLGYKLTKSSLQIQFNYNENTHNITHRKKSNIKFTQNKKGPYIVKKKMSKIRMKEQVFQTLRYRIVVIKTMWY